MKEIHVKKTLILFSLCSLILIPGLAAAQMTSQEYDQLGQAVFQKGLYDKAVGYFQQAVQADPNNAQAYEDLGNAYMKQNDQSDAVAAYQKSLKINPNNPTLKVMVDNLNSTAVPNSSTVATEPSTNDTVEEQQPAQKTIVIKRRAPRPQPAPVNYNDGLAPIDHARIWSKFEFGFNYSLQGDLMNSVTTNNNENTAGTLPYGFDSGNAAMAPGGMNIGGEIGFLLNPNNGIAIGVRYLQANDYTFNANNSQPASVVGAPQDSEDTTFTPYVVPITLDYYLFLPDSGGRFFLTAGVGYYSAAVHVSENLSLSNYYYDYNAYWNPGGD